MGIYSNMNLSLVFLGYLVLLHMEMSLPMYIHQDRSDRAGVV